MYFVKNSSALLDVQQNSWIEKLVFHGEFDDATRHVVTCSLDKGWNWQRAANYAVFDLSECSKNIGAFKFKVNGPMHDDIEWHSCDDSHSTMRVRKLRKSTHDVQLETVTNNVIKSFSVRTHDDALSAVPQIEVHTPGVKVHWTRIKVE